MQINSVVFPMKKSENLRLSHAFRGNRKESSRLNIMQTLEYIYYHYFMFNWKGPESLIILSNDIHLP